MPSPGETLTGSALAILPGGKGANQAPAASLPPELLRDVDVLVVNASEAASLAAALEVAAAPDDFARDVASRFSNVVIVTLGAQGAIASVKGKHVVVAAAPTVIAVDTTGAGDALTGALAAALDRGAPVGMALPEGVAAGALACTAHGAQAALPDVRAIRAPAAMI